MITKKITKLPHHAGTCLFMLSQTFPTFRNARLKIMLLFTSKFTLDIQVQFHMKASRNIVVI